MAYNREELFNLPVEERYELVMDLWESIDEELLPVTKEEIEFAKERLELHKKNPSQGISTEIQSKIRAKYGF